MNAELIGSPNGACIYSLCQLELVCNGVAIMMKCEKCNCETHVIYVTQCDGNVCDKCRIDLVKCRCDESPEAQQKKKVT